MDMIDQAYQWETYENTLLNGKTFKICPLSPGICEEAAIELLIPYAAP